MNLDSELSLMYHGNDRIDGFLKEIIVFRSSLTNMREATRPCRDHLGQAYAQEASG